VSLTVLLTVTLLASACDRPDHKSETDKKPAPCTTVGQQCEFLPGKLGACVMPTGCTDNSCLICQSQH
jgi:hypothetical protein